MAMAGLEPEQDDLDVRLHRALERHATRALAKPGATGAASSAGKCGEVDTVAAGLNGSLGCTGEGGSSEGLQRQPHANWQRTRQHGVRVKVPQLADAMTASLPPPPPLLSAPTARMVQQLLAIANLGNVGSQDAAHNRFSGHARPQRSRANQATTPLLAPIVPRPLPPSQSRLQSQSRIPAAAAAMQRARSDEHCHGAFGTRSNHTPWYDEAGGPDCEELNGRQRQAQELLRTQDQSQPTSQPYRACHTSALAGDELSQARVNCCCGWMDGLLHRSFSHLVSGQRHWHLHQYAATC
jgi:hypothetical protein